MNKNKDYMNRSSQKTKSAFGCRWWSPSTERCCCSTRLSPL